MFRSCKHCLLWLLLVLPFPVLAETPLPNGAAFEVGFSPSRGALDVVLAAIGAAQHSVQVAAYGFSSKPVAMALLAAQQRGVNVQVVADRKDNRKAYSAVTFLANQGVPVRLNGHYAIHHHKFIVVDGQHLELGSFNYTAAAASKNAENALLLWRVPALAAVYQTEWQRLWDEAEPLAPAY